MTIPRLYEQVTLRSHAEIRYIDGRPEGYGGGSPFAMGLNTLVSRNFTDYVKTLRIVGDWREHDVEDYKQGRVPDNSMVLQIAVRAALDKMKSLESFAWELNTKPLNTLYQGLVNRGATLTSFTLRCQTKRIPRPTTIISPLPNLKTLVVYDIDPLCYPDDISLLLVGAKKLENLKLHWSPRMREAGEESVNLLTLFGQCIAARHSIPLKRMAIYNLYTRFIGDNFQDIIDPTTQQELTVFNSMGSSDPMTVFLDDSWKVSSARPVPHNLKMLRSNHADKDAAAMLGQFTGLERLYIISRRGKQDSKSVSTAATPTTPSSATPNLNGSTTSAHGTPTISDHQWRSIGGEYLAMIQLHHKTMKHLLLNERWQLSDETVLKLCRACPDLEQLGFACGVPPMESLRRIIGLVPKLWAMRILIAPGTELATTIEAMDSEMHAFALATEMWRPEYRNIKYVGLGDNIVLKLGRVIFPPKGVTRIPEGQENSMNAKRAGPVRMVEVVSRESVDWIEIWGLDTTEFDPKFP